MVAKRWTDSQVAKMETMRQQGKSLAEIAAKFGTSVNNVRTLVWRHPAGKVARGEKSKREEELEKRVANLQEQLAQAKKAKAKTVAPKFTRKKGDFVRVCVADTHGNLVNQKALAAFLSDLEVLNPQEVVLLGDHLDCGAFLNEHHTLGYVADTEDSFVDDVAAANQFLDDVQLRCKSTQFHYMMGNHEQRIDRWICSRVGKNPKDAKYFREMFSPEKVLSLKERGVPWYDRNQFYCGLALPGVLKLGHCHFIHGSRYGRTALDSMLRDFGGNVVMGDIHVLDSKTVRSVTKESFGAWCVGCLCNLQPTYRNTTITKWNHGYGVQFVRQSGEFLHVNVPIVDGQSLLAPFLQSVA
jgi:hypothetical protein